MTSSETASAPAGAPRVALAAIVAAVITATANSVVAIVAVALGATQTQQLMPPVDIVFSVVASVAGAIGWATIRRRAKDPARTLRFVVPIVLLISFVPDALLAAGTASRTGWAPIVALVVMHLLTISIAVTVYSRVLPVRAARASAAEA